MRLYIRNKCDECLNRGCCPAGKEQYMDAVKKVAASVEKVEWYGRLTAECDYYVQDNSAGGGLATMDGGESDG